MKKINLDELSSELEVIDSDQLYCIKGGYGSTSGGFGNCSFLFGPNNGGGGDYSGGGGGYSGSGGDSTALAAAAWNATPDGGSSTFNNVGDNAYIGTITVTGDDGSSKNVEYKGCYVNVSAAETVTVSTQDGQTCVPAAMSYTAMILGTNNNTNYYVSVIQNSNTGNYNVEDNGTQLTDGQMTTLINSQFTTETLSQSKGMFNALDSGYPILAELSVPGTGQYHEITIIGYDKTSSNDPQLLYMDTNTGQTNTMSLSAFNSGSVRNPTVITGTK